MIFQPSPAPVPVSQTGSNVPPRTFAQMRRLGLPRPPRPPITTPPPPPAPSPNGPVVQQPRPPVTTPPPPPAPAPNGPVVATQTPVAGGLIPQATNRPALNIPQAAQFERTQSPVHGQLMAALQQMLAAPSAYNADEAEATFNRLNARLDDSFALEKEALDGTMATRGLHDSTIAATELGRLGNRQAQAKADLAGQVHENMVRDLAAARRDAVAAGMAFDQNDTAANLAAFQANEAARSGAVDRAVTEFGARQGAYEFDRTLQESAAERALRAALGAQSNNIDLMRLGLDRDELAMRGRQFDSELDFRRGESEADRTFRREELTSRNDQFLKDLEFRAKQGDTTALLSLANLLGVDKLGKGALDSLISRFGGGVISGGAGSPSIPSGYNPPNPFSPPTGQPYSNTPYGFNPNEPY